MTPYRMPEVPGARRLVSLNEARARAKWMRFRERRRKQARSALVRRIARPVVGSFAAAVGIGIGGEVAWWTGSQEFEHYCRFIGAAFAIALVALGSVAVVMPKEKP